MLRLVSFVEPACEARMLFVHVHIGSIVGCRSASNQKLVSSVLLPTRSRAGSFDIDWSEYATSQNVKYACNVT